MRCKIHSLSTSLSFNTNTCISRYYSVARLAAGAGLSRAGRNGRRAHAHAQELVYRNVRPLVQPVRPTAPRIIQNTVHQTVVHLHQTTHQHILNRLSTARDAQGNATLLVRQTAMQPAPDGPMDESRPALAARRMLRVLSAESARQTLRPFYRDMLHTLLAQEREEYRDKPAQSLLLVRNVLGRRTLDTLRRFYRQTTEQLDGSILHSLVCRRYVRRIQRDVSGGLAPRYASREVDVTENLCRLPATKRVSSPLQPPEPKREREPEERRPEPSPMERGIQLTEQDFQVLVRSVANALGSRQRLESLRRGGM